MKGFCLLNVEDQINEEVDTKSDFNKDFNGVEPANMRSSVLDKDARVKTPQTFSIKNLVENIQSSDENLHNFDQIARRPSILFEPFTGNNPQEQVYDIDTNSPIKQ